MDYRDGFVYYGTFSPFDVINNQQFNRVGMGYIDENTHTIPVSTKDPSSAGDMHSVGQTVTVSYIRSDGEELTDSYTIEVLPDPDSALPDYTRNSILYNGAYYEVDKNLNAEAHYASGTVWVRGSGTIYNARDAVALGLLKPKYVHD